MGKVVISQVSVPRGHKWHECVPGPTTSKTKCAIKSGVGPMVLTDSRVYLCLGWVGMTRQADGHPILIPCPGEDDWACCKVLETSEATSNQFKR